jgi:carbon storage regulator
MLVLSRKPGEEIVIGDEIRLVVLRVRGKQVQIGLEAPREISIRREELPAKADLGTSPDRNGG